MSYKTISEYNNTRKLTPRPDIACKSYAVYDSYNRKVYGCSDRYNQITKGTVNFVYTPDSDSCYKNKRCS